jgi:hypothetical protein
MRRLQRANRFDIHRFRAADFGHVANLVARMHAKAGAPDDQRFEAESKQQFGDARHQRDDARTGTRFLVRDAGCIDRTQ